MAARLGEPLGLVDVGCSAGLNLLCDRYLLDHGPAGSTGPPGAALRISCDIVGGNPPIAPTLPSVAARVGIDRDRVDVSDDDDARWLLAGVWPDTGRLERTRRALEEARSAPPRLVRGDAVESVTDVVRGLPAAIVPVVITSAALAYLSPEDRVVFRETLAAASRDRPVAWVSSDSPGIVDLFADTRAPSDAHGMMANVLGLVVFRGDELDPDLLAFVHPHGNWIDWRGQ